jgi:Uma2 family endonuclease
MRIARNLHRYTYEAYLEFEEGNSARHEFLDGEIYAMAGRTLQHAAITAAVIASLGAQLRGRPCVVYTSDLKVRVLSTGLTTYPDATVICGPAQTDPKSEHVAINPTLIVEVTSPSTEDWDRGEKLEHYKAIPSLQELVLVSHRERDLEVHRRTEDGSWIREGLAADGTLTLSSVGCTLQATEVYRNAGIAG